MLLKILIFLSLNDPFFIFFRKLLFGMIIENQAL